MHHSRLLLLFFIAFSVWVTGCAPSVKVTDSRQPSTTITAGSRNVTVLEHGQPRPNEAESLGIVRISDTGFSTNCSYPEVLKLAREATLKAGGNAMQILQHQTPDSWSTCHRIEVAMLFIPGIANYQPVKPSSIPHPDLEKVKARQKFLYDSLAAISEDVFIEQHPQYPGGQDAMMKFLSSSVKYPETAMRDRISGQVIGSFVVDQNGEITDPKILKSVREDIDQEFIRIIMSMPAWKPGFQNGRAVKVRYNIPIDFWCGRSPKKK
ncbi:energy transducer TonB [Adhaeribacter sp. BT258]|uniref:Energy transducer TonB n=1 Tax=Adhaeribacter terrigena TaxID=2793070 RepID=A0ABS1BXA8_9BACT|nr:energy transducer TonB [Adhaeribacter terrigena]MBK0401779.1 energy transducer TonB [Adhaeribacter terrigena]